MIHKTKKEEGKKHLWGQNFGGSGEFQGRFRPFSACFGRIGRRRIWPDFGRISPIWRELKPIQCESSHVSANPRQKKKKNSNAVQRRGQPHRTSRPMSVAGATPSQLHPCFLAYNWPRHTPLLMNLASSYTCRVTAWLKLHPPINWHKSPSYPIRKPVSHVDSTKYMQKQTTN